MKERPVSPTGLEHDRPYMKLDIWNPGDIERKFGHDPATYPNQDIYQHYPTTQFNPGVRVDLDAAIDSNLNIHVMPHQKAIHTLRPGFQNAPSGLHSYESLLKVDENSSNEEGIIAAKAYGAKVEKGEVCYAKADTKARTVRPGYQNIAVDVVDGKAHLAVSETTSNKEGLDHAKVNEIPVKGGYEVIAGSCKAPEKPAPTTKPKPAKNEECDPNNTDGTLCDTENKQDAAAAAVDKLLGNTGTSGPTQD